MAKTRCISVLFMFMLLAFIHSQALAGFFTGNDLVVLIPEYEKAEAKASDVEDWGKAWLYSGYVSGVYDATQDLYNIPVSPSRRQINAVVTKYLKNHPEKWSESAANLVIKALKEAFPLKKSK
jgi:hypothetical protein